MNRKIVFAIMFLSLLTAVGIRSNAQIAVVDSTSTYTPTTITNGSFDEEPWMDYTYNGVHYTSCPHTWEENHAVSDIVFHGIGEGWNTTETETWRGNLFEYTCGEHSHVYQHNPSIPLTDKYIEMNCHHSTVFYQDLITYGHDVIRFTLKHAVTTSSSASNLQSMRVEIGAPELDGYGSIVNASGQGDNVNSHILPLSKAIYRNNGVTDNYGNTSTLGFAGPDIANLLLDRNAQSNGWFEASAAYVVPEGQTVSRFAFISEADSPNFGNLMDDITFSTLIGNLMAVANDDCSVTITGYWGDTDTEKNLNIRIGDNIIPIDMSPVCGNNFKITIPNDMIALATQVDVYHQDYEQAKQTVEIIKYKHKSYIFDTTCHGSDGYHGHGFDIAGPLMPGIYNDSLYIESQTVCSDSVVYLTLTVFDNPTIPLPDNVDTADCIYYPEGTDWNIKIDWSSDPVVSNLNTPFVGDLDNDGHPEVICFSKNSDSSTDPRTNRQILVFDGVTRQLKSTITMPSFVTAYDATAYGLVKLPSKKGLIIVANYDYKLRAYDITSSDPNTPYWVSDVDYGSNHGDWAVNVGFADFNHDGHPELYVRDKIYNAETGKLLAAATGGSNTASSYCHFSHLTHWKLSSPIAADLCGDANLDLILGNEIYKVNITNTSGTEGNSIVLYKQITPPNGILADGNPQVADFNNDGRLDVFISVRDTDSHNGTVYCYVWDVSNNTVSTPLQISTSFSGKSIPMISDIDNDGMLEILIQCHISSSNDKFQAYKYDPETKTFSYQWGLSTDEDSYSNSITSFDFNQDGLLELLICDQSRIRIINGSGKSHKTHNDTIPMYVLSTFNFYEITIMQYPVIADVDNDGRAEIISVGSDKLNFFKSVDNSWAPTRKVWNQYMYNVTNVNNDLTIPQYQFNNATAFTDPDNIVRHPYNNYLQQATTIDQYGRPFYGIPDVAITNISGSQTDEGLTLSIDYTNNGDNIFNAPYYITVFANQYGGNILNTSTVNEPLNADDTTQTQISLSFNELCQYPDLSRIVAALNCDGIGIAQNGGHQNECDTTNNLISLEIDIKPDTISVSQAACEEYEWFDSIYAESGVYYYTKSTEGACDSIFELSLTIFDSPTITISGNTYINAGESVTLTASGADTYVWSTGETGDSISVSPDDNTTYSVVGTDENGCTGTASFTVKLRVNVGIPVYVAMRDTSDCHIDGHVYSFKLEPLTTGAPMPENDVIDIEAPTVNGIAGKRGFGPEDADNPWRMAFENGTWNYKISQVPDSVPTADSLDNGYWAISILITSDSIQKWEIISAEYNVPIGDMTAASFYIVKEYESGVNETAADVSVDEFGRTRLVLGGDEVRDIDAFNMAVIKSKFEIDFRRNFTAIGSVTPPPAAVPDGTLVGFIANPTVPTSSMLNGGGALGIYGRNNFNYGIVLEFDSFLNGTFYADPNYKHFGLMKVDKNANPVSLDQFYDMTQCWPTSACTYSIVNDTTTNKLTFNLRLPDNTVQTYVYDNPTEAFGGATTAYLLMSGAIRRGPGKSFGLGSVGSTAPSLEMYFESFTYAGKHDGFNEEDCIFINYLGHEWIYSSEDNILKARCTHDSGDPEINSCTNPGFKNLIITAEDKNHDGNVYDKASYTTDEWTGIGLEIPALEYVGIGHTSFAQSTGAPSGCGTYKALATVSDTITAEDDFNIKPSITYSADEHAEAFVRFSNDSLIPSGSFVNPFDTLTATVAIEFVNRWKFTSWTNGVGGALLSENEIYSFVIDRDTVIHANIELNIIETNLTDTACYSESGYHKYGFDIDSLALGLNYDTLYSISTILGCDSIVYLELFVAPIYDTTLYDTICRNESYNQHGFDLDSLPVGWHFDTINPGTILGCDSIVYLELFVAPIYDTTFIDSICRNEGYHDHGFDLDSLTVGWHFDTINPGTVLGCDSIVYLELFVAPIYDTTFIDSICRNESYNEHGFALDSLPVGWHFDTINPGTVLGCDSIVYLELFVAPIYDTTFYDTICRNESYNEHGFALDSLPVGWHFDTINPGTILGCDSIVYLELFVAPIYDTTFIDSICRNESYNEHGFDLDSLPVGWHFDTINPGTILGCDSITYLELYVAPVFDTTFYDTICFGSGYHEHGFDLDSLDLEIGMNFDTLFLQTTLGCDSIVYLELLVGDVFEVNFTDTTCVNEGYHQHGFEIDSPGLGWLYDTLFLSSVVGCDSTVYLELFVAPIYDTTFYDTICYGNNYYEHGFSIENPNVGWNFDTINPGTTLGCDSLVYLELYVAPYYKIDFFDTICFGEDYHQHGFDFVNPEVGLHNDYHELLTTLGCDSIVVMNLFVGEVYDIKLYDTICFGEDYDKYNFHFVNPPVGTNSETQALSSMYGCDSTVNLKLYVASIYNFTVYDSICEGEYYTNYGLFLPKPDPGFYNLVSSLETELGCDSVFNVNLKVINTFKTPDTLYGLSSVFVSTDLLSGKYKYSIDTITGCREYHWEIDNDKWLMYPDKNECTIIVTTPEVTTLTVRAGNSCGEVSKSIEIHAGYFGVDENETVKASVYPNPSNGYVNVEADGIEAVNILGATGVVVKSYKFERENLVSIDISGMPNSIYVFEIVTRDGRCIRRITKTGY